MHKFSIGNKVSFTDKRYHIGKNRQSIQLKTVCGTITEIDDMDRATIKLNRSKNTRLVHVSHLQLQEEGKPSALAQAFINAVCESNQIAAECDKEVRP